MDKYTINALAITGGIVAALFGIYSAATMNDPPHASSTSGATRSKAANVIDTGRAAVLAKMRDPDSAQFRELFVAEAKPGVFILCGEVNGKNGFGGFTGFQRFFAGGDVNGGTMVVIASDSLVDGVVQKMCASRVASQ